MSWVSSTHHVLGIEHLLGQFRDGQSSVLLRASAGQRCETDHEEMQSWERNQVDSQFSQVTVQLTSESQAASDTAHSSRHQMVQITISWGGQLEGSEADIIQSLVVNDHALISIFN